jgi:serine/threonine-protein phosphatase 6 regulatory ankyrin repeat subunit B
MQSLSKVRCLVKAGADVNLRDNIGRTALMDAAWRIDSYAVFDCLASTGADINAKDLNGRNALMLASGSGNVKAVKDLIKLGADVNVQDNSGKTALMEAAWNFTDESSREVVAELVKSGADVNVQDNEGESALMYAYNDVVKMEELIKAGANVNLQNNEGKTVLMKVAGSFCGEHPPLTDLLLKENRKIFKENKKTFKENEKALELLIENGADVNIKDNKGRNAIMYVKDDERKRRIIFDAIKKARSGEEASNNVGRIKGMFR